MMGKRAIDNLRPLLRIVDREAERLASGEE